LTKELEPAGGAGLISRRSRTRPSLGAGDRPPEFTDAADTFFPSVWVAG